MTIRPTICTSTRRTWLSFQPSASKTRGRSMSHTRSATSSILGTCPIAWSSHRAIAAKAWLQAKKPVNWIWSSAALALTVTMRISSHITSSNNRKIRMRLWSSRVALKVLIWERLSRYLILSTTYTWKMIMAQMASLSGISSVSRTQGKTESIASISSTLWSQTQTIIKAWNHLFIASKRLKKAG